MNSFRWKQLFFRISAVVFSAGATLASLSLIIFLGIKILNPLAFDNPITCGGNGQEETQPFNPTIRNFLHPIFGLWLEPETTIPAGFFAATGRPAGIYGYRINDQGLRELPTHTTPESADVWLVGGSITFGSGLDYWQSLAGLIEQRFETRVANLAMVGATTENFIRELPYFLSTGHPRLIIILTGINDSSIDQLENDANWQKSRRIDHWFEANPGHLFLPNPIIRFIRQLIHPARDVNRISPTTYQHNLRRLFQMCQSRQIKVLFAGETFAGREFMSQSENQECFRRQAGRGVTSLTEWLSTMPEDQYPEYFVFGSFPNYLRLAQNLCSEMTVPFIDLNTALWENCAITGRSPRDFFCGTIMVGKRNLLDMIHPTPEGMEIASRPVLQALENLGLPLRQIELGTNHSPWFISPVPFDLDSVPIEPARNYLSAVVVTRTEGQTLLNRDLYYQTPEGKILPVWQKPLPPFRQRLFPHTADYSLRIKPWTWKVGFKSRAEVINGAVVLTWDDYRRLRSLISAQPNAYVALVVEDLPLL